jgi:hypothetical protein
MGWPRQDQGEDEASESKSTKLYKILKDLLLVALGAALDFAITHYSDFDFKTIIYRPIQRNLIAGTFIDKEDAEELCSHIVVHGINANIILLKSGTTPMYIVSIKTTGLKDESEIIKKLKEISIFVESTEG